MAQLLITIIAVIVRTLQNTHIPSFSPELIRVADGLRATQLGVQVVVDSPHLSDSYPVLAFERQPERPPAQVGWHVQDEARHVGKLDAAYVPGGRKAI